MYSNFKDKAIDFVKEAVAEDTAGNYEKALSLYINALEYFKTHLKYEKNPRSKEAITAKFTEYLARAEEIRKLLDNKQQNGGNVAMGMLPTPQGNPAEQRQIAAHANPLSFQEHCLFSVFWNLHVLW